MVFEEKRRKKRFGENVSGHIGSRNPIRLEQAFRDMFMDKVVSDIDVFGTRGDHFGFNKSYSILIVAKERERARNRKSVYSEE